MLETNNEAQQAAKEKALMMRQADKWFSRIDPQISNGRLLITSIDSPGVSTFIVERLTGMEQAGVPFGEDQELNAWFDNQIRSAEIRAPEDPVDRLRWLALLCITASRKESFSFGNVVLVPDYLPDTSEEFESYISIYGSGVLDGIIAKRESLRK